MAPPRTTVITTRGAMMIHKAMMWTKTEAWTLPNTALLLRHRKWHTHKSVTGAPGSCPDSYSDTEQWKKPKSCLLAFRKVGDPNLQFTLQEIQRSGLFLRRIGPAWHCCYRHLEANGPPKGCVLPTNTETHTGSSDADKFLLKTHFVNFLSLSGKSTAFCIPRNLCQTATLEPRVFLITFIFLYSWFRAPETGNMQPFLHKPIKQLEIPPFIAFCL